MNKAGLRGTARHGWSTIVGGAGVVIALAIAVAASPGRSPSGPDYSASLMRPASIPSVELEPLAAFRAAPNSQPPVDCSSAFGSPSPVFCYGPADLHAAYDFPSGPKAPTGAGQTILIVDAYATDYEAATGDSLNDDLALFDQVFGIPPLPGGVTIVPGPASTCSGPPDCSGDPYGWAGEIALDVEWAHAMAPGARIVLASASSDSSDDITAAEAAILPSYPGAIVSQSFGGDEADGNGVADPADAPAHAVFVAAAAAGDTLLAAAGDNGATDGNAYVVPWYPASDPLVLSIGGTQGHPYPNGLWRNGHYGGEEVWNEPQFVDPQLGPVATGGAPSVVWPAPSWQLGLSQYSSGRHPMRTVPDVSYTAGNEGGVFTVLGCPDTQPGCQPGDGPALFIVGGTSVGTPQWAAIIALADELRAAHKQGGLGVAAVPLYAIARNPHSYHADFNDVTIGNNAQGSGNHPIKHDALGFTANPGYDLATGLGTPDVSRLLVDLENTPAGTPPSGLGGPPGTPGHHPGHKHVRPG
jgi:subtilase family serine protease